MDLKRQNDDEVHDFSMLRQLKRQKTSPAYYTIAWICALYMERTAAEAMLDEVHPGLTQPANDPNTYTLGSIGQQNIVIASLPQYGTVRANTVLSHLIRTFPSIGLVLMVGIGGGVPGINADIRLGDIVVGSRVISYDLSKVGRDGKIERTDVPRLIHHRAGTAVSTLRSKHELNGSQIQSILQERLAGSLRYSHPNLPDILFQPIYNHEEVSALTCDGCDPGKIVRRRERNSNKPQVHYGPIASGNQVIKDGVSRDQYASDLDGIMCFEMESAGLVDQLPCLPIRGISDYCDTHKNKTWQNYAAAVAAAYARELVEVLPIDEGSMKALMPATTPDLSESNTSENDRQERRKRLLESLQFEQIDARKTTIKAAHSKTCRWLLKLPEYQQWLDHQQVKNHHGFLWIRGKPGAGKSTIMKFTYGQIKKKDQVGFILTISFFFNARGDYLERSISGMYRSLLYQLLEAFPDLQNIFDDPDVIPRMQTDCPSLDALKTLLCNAVMGLGTRSLTCYIDALDECDEQQVTDMVRFFEDLSESCAEQNIRLKVCFSSRHYPYIDIKVGHRITLEKQAGHAEDLAKYIQATLTIKDLKLLEELQAELLKKSAGVFLWLILVVDILNKEIRRGAYALRKKLSEVPSGLTDLFRDLIRRDNENMEDFQLSIMWILYAKRPLHPAEYYYAICSGLAMRGLADAQALSVEAEEIDDRAEKSVISSSKGLAEITKGKKPTVQFIHESVRDFLLKDGGLYNIWPDLGMDWEGSGHETLKQCCKFYLAQATANRGIDQLLLEKSVSPFLGYAAHNSLYHANAAATVYPQADFLSDFPLAEWIQVRNAMEDKKIRRYTKDARIVYILADQGLSQLIQTWIKHFSSVKDELKAESVLEERYQHPLFAALACGNKEAIAALLGSQSTIFYGCDITEELSTRASFETRGYKRRTPLTWAAEQGLGGLVRWILDAGVAPDSPDKGNQTALARASANNKWESVKHLVEHQADYHGKTPLIYAVLTGHEQVAKVLLEHQADVNHADYESRTPLIWAALTGHEQVVKVLLEHQADVNHADYESRTPLIWAALGGYKEAIKLLLEYQADVNHADHKGRTPLIYAALGGYEEVAKLLLQHGADINQADQSGKTPYIRAISQGYEQIAKLLLQHEAGVDQINQN